MFYKQIIDGYIFSIGIGNCGTEISENEYNQLQQIIASKPAPTENIDYKLKENLTWEPYEILEVDPGISDSEALEILLGGV